MCLHTNGLPARPTRHPRALGRPPYARGVRLGACPPGALGAADRGASVARADVRERASRAVELAGAADVRNSLWPTMIFGQARAIAFDLLQASGEAPDAARALLDAAATTKVAEPPPS